MKRRYLYPHLLKDLPSKMVFISGPRQVGKTTLARSLNSEAYYLNFDVVSDRAIIQKQAWDKTAPLLILDELHKLKKWKLWLKGVWDSELRPLQILVTGSARFDTFRRGGDSLAGRFYHYHLHPFSMAELKNTYSIEESFERLLSRGGFPEPFLAKDTTAAERWRSTHLDRIVRDDVDAVERVSDIRQLELLVELLSERVGSPLSYQSLSEDLSVSPPTVKRWIEVLESLYVIFLVRPYSKSLTRAIRKEPKFYFYDIGRVRGDDGVRFENLVACHLQKRNDFLTATTGKSYALFYIRDKEKREVDFFITAQSKPEYLIEAKLTQGDVAQPLVYYAARLPCPALQLVREISKKYSHGAVSVVPAASWLAGLEA